MQQVRQAKVGQSTYTYRATENIFYQEKSNRMIYNPTVKPVNETNREHLSQVVYVNAELQNSCRISVKQTDAAGGSQEKKNRHVHFAEPLVTYRYIDQFCEAKQKYDTELVGVRKLVKALPNNPGKSEATIEQKRTLLKRLEDLGEAVERSQEAFEAELEAEREKNRLLKQKLRKRKVSHNKECLQFKTELLNAKVQADVLQQKVLLQEELKLELANAKMMSQSLQGQLDEEIHLKNTLIMHFKELAAIVSSSPQNSSDLQKEGEEEPDPLKVLCKRNCQRYDTQPGSPKQKDVFHCRRQAFWPNDLLQEELRTASSEAGEDISDEVCFTQQDCHQSRGAGGTEERAELAPSLWNTIWYIVGLWKSQRWNLDSYSK